MLASDASLIMAARVATELYALSPENEEYRRLYLATNLAAAKIMGGLDRVLPSSVGSLASEAGKDRVAVLNDVLDWSLDHGHREAAIGAAEMLGQLGDIDALRSTNGRLTPLARALDNKDRHVRFAALQEESKEGA